MSIELGNFTQAELNVLWQALDLSEEILVEELIDRIDNCRV